MDISPGTFDTGNNTFDVVLAGDESIRVDINGVVLEIYTRDDGSVVVEHWGPNTPIYL